MADGWIKIHRTVFDNEYYFSDTFTRMQAWFDLLLIANHKPRKLYIRGCEVSVNRGQVCYAAETLAKRWGWSRGKVKRFLNELQNRHQIVQQNSNLITVISIVNYSFYQGGGNGSSTTDGTTNGTASNTTDSTTDGQQTDTNKKEKKERKEYVCTHPLQIFIKEKYPTVFSMDEKITPEQCDTLISKFGKPMIVTILGQMENWKPLLKKNTSAYLTLNNWCDREVEKNPPAVSNKFQGWV